MKPFAIFLGVPGVIVGDRPRIAWPNEAWVEVSARARGSARTITEARVSPEAVDHLGSVIGECLAEVFWVTDWARDGRLECFLDELLGVDLPPGVWIAPSSRDRSHEKPSARWHAAAIARQLALLTPQTRYVWLSAGATRWRRYLRNAAPNDGLLIPTSPVTGITRLDVEAIKRFRDGAPLAPRKRRRGSRLAQLPQHELRTARRIDELLADERGG